MSDLLGNLVWYTVHDCEISREQILSSLVEAGLKTGFAPAKIQPSDAFRRATSDVETKRLPADDGTFINLLVREVRSDRDQIVRHLVREVVDAQNRRLSYKQVARLTLNKGNGTKGFGALEDEAGNREALTVEESNALADAMRRYDRYRNAYQGNHLREVIRGVLKTLAPVAVRPSGGVYFVPGEHADTVNRLKKFAKGIGAEMWTMPVLNDDNARAAIKSSLGQEVQDTAHRLAAQLAKNLKARGEISETQQRIAVEELQRLQKLTARYEDLLQEQLLDTQANLNAISRQVKTLLVA